MGAGRRSQGIEQELKAKIRFDSSVFVVYFSVPISYETFCTRSLEACQLPSSTKVTIKVIDDEGWLNFKYSCILLVDPLKYPI
jgi:hypothetical protein